MPLGPFVASEVVGWLLGALLMLVLAAWLLCLDTRSPVHRSFASLLLVLGCLNVASALLFSGERVVSPWLYPLALIAAPFATLYFVGVYRSSRVTGVSHPLLLALNASCGLVLVGMFLLAPGLFWPVSATDDFGPLIVVSGLLYLVLAIVALLFGLDYLRAPKGAGRRSLLLMSLGFSFLPGYVVAQDVLFIDVLRDQSVSGFTFVAHALAVVALGPLVLLFAALTRSAWVSQDEEVKQDLSRFLLVFLGPVLAVLMLWGLYRLGEDYVAASTAAEGAWTVAFPLVVGYGVLRHGLSGVDGRAQVVLPGLVVAGGVGGATLLAGRWLSGLVGVNAWLVAFVAAAALLPLWPVWYRLAVRLLSRCVLVRGSFNRAQP